ncbi:MAG: ImmA/IrrE family metallo-endopeptidase [Mycobacteriales bacterium]
MTNEQEARRRAEAFRERFEIGTRPLGDLFELVHDTVGCDVLAMSADGAEHGLSMADPLSGRAVIAVAITEHPMRQRSSIAHELGHILAGDVDRELDHPPGVRSDEEIQADAFARHLLLPLAAVSPHGADVAVDEAWLSHLVQEFCVSPHIAAIQLKDARLIDDDTSQQWSRFRAGTVAARYGWLSQYQAMSAASSQPRAPQSLMRRAAEGYRIGVLGIAELSAWYGVPAEILDAELELSAATDDAGSTVGHDWDEDAPLLPPGFAPPSPSS